MKVKSILPSVCVAAVLTSLQAVGQSPGGLTISGPNPWIDITAGPYNAACNGVTGTDDTGAIQKGLNDVLAGGSALFIPPTLTGCRVSGVVVPVIFALSGSCSGGVCIATITLNAAIGSLANFPPPGGLINIHNVQLGSNDTNFNGTFQIASNNSSSINSSFPVLACTPNTAGDICISYFVQNQNNNSETGFVPNTNAVAEVGLYFAGSNLKVIGTANGQASSNPGGSMLVTDQAITILTTMTPSAVNSPANFAHTGPDVQNITFNDAGNKAFAGLNIGLTAGFNVSNNGFYGFTASSSYASVDPQGGAAIVTTAGQQTPGVSSPFVEYGTITNNNIQNVRIGFTSRFSVSSVTFLNNQVQCSTTGGANPPNAGSVGLDIGGIWYLNNYDHNFLPTNAINLTGGENRVINQQNEACMVGTMLGAQNNDRVETKLENDIMTGAACNVHGNFGSTKPTNLCTLGLAVLNTTDSTLFNQSKTAVAGLYIDTNSSNNTVYENRTSGILANQPLGTTLTGLCQAYPSCKTGVPSYSSLMSQSLVIDSAVAPGTSIFGIPSGGSFVPTSGSTFTNDYDPLLNSGGITTQQTASYAATLTDQYILCNVASPSSMTVTLPTSGQLSGKAYRIKNVNTGTCTVNVVGGVNIDNSPNFPLSRWQSIVAVYNGTQYYIF